MNYLKSLLAQDETGADSIVLAGLLCVLTLCAVSVVLAVLDHASWSPMGFSTAAATVIGAGAAGKTARDRLSTPPGGAK